MGEPIKSSDFYEYRDDHRPGRVPYGYQIVRADPCTDCRGTGTLAPLPHSVRAPLDPCPTCDSAGFNLWFDLWPGFTRCVACEGTGRTDKDYGRERCPLCFYGVATLAESDRWLIDESFPA